ncbi:uncharacterized protein LOC130693404 [Daphnia carinata]|uniref:uncharacterized protein LOC130693404 n=1 Tax=Daphnia carinata TaxID=120202 RepID=UPI00257EE0B2|nr:uncharacterized protein LOC130693404 [Daphnia carinata]
MSTLRFIMLVGAAMIVTHFRGTNSLPLGQKAAILIDVDDSHETSATMDLPDSMESTLNKSLEDDDSLEDDHLVKRYSIMASAHPAESLVAAGTQHAVPQLNVRVRDGFSWEDLVKDLAKVDVSDKSQSTVQVAHVTVDPDDSLEDVLEKLADPHNVRVSTFTDPASVESSPLDDDHSLEDVKIIQKTIQTQTSSTGQVQQTRVGLVFQDDDEIDDFSLEDYVQWINPDAVQLTKMNFHHLPTTLFSHPTSDDWFLTRHYMDDHFVWALGDELAKEYFWQPVKASSNLNSGSSVAGDIAQLTPVRSLWDDRL